MTEEVDTTGHPRINPLKRVSKELFQHGQEHSRHESAFDRLVAGVHVDNALELFLKSYAAKYNIQGYKQKLVPELITLLQPHVPELTSFGGDLRIFHDLRDVAYHMGLPLDDINLSWGIETIKVFCDQVEQRERQEIATFTNGGSPESRHSYGKAQRELEVAIDLFRQLPFGSTKEQIATVLWHMFKAVEYWVDDRLSKRPRLVEKNEISKLTLNKKIEILRGEIKDAVLLNELQRINDLRNTMVHSKEIRIAPNEVYKYLQIVTHFVKVESPSRYGTWIEGREAEEKVKSILEKYGFAFERECLLEGYARKSRFDFVIERERIVIELRHNKSRTPERTPDIFLESLVFRIVDLKKADKRWKFVVVLSGPWSKRSEEMLKKYSDYVVKVEDFETLVQRMSISSRHSRRQDLV